MTREEIRKTSIKNWMKLCTQTRIYDGDLVLMNLFNLFTIDFLYFVQRGVWGIFNPKHLHRIFKYIKLDVRLGQQNVCIDNQTLLTNTC